MLEKPRRVIDRRYVQWIKQQPCFGIAAAGMLGEYQRSCEGPMDHHHVKELGQGKMGSKPDDRRSVPACRRHHQIAEAAPNYFRGFFAVLILDLNLAYDATHPKRVRKERKVSPTVQHLLIRCECRETHRVPSSKASVVTSAEGSRIRYWCGRLKVYRNAWFRRGA